MSEKLQEMLIRHEGNILFPYQDTVGKTTIGIGRNLTDNGITDAEARMMLSYDIEVAKTGLIKFNWFIALDDVRKDVITDMVFNIGLHRFLGFSNLVAALVKSDYEKAAKEMMNSKWAAQVGERAVELSAMMLSGKYIK